MVQQVLGESSRAVVRHHVKQIVHEVACHSQISLQMPNASHTTPTHAHGMSSSCRFIQITHYSLLVSSCTGGEAEQRMRCVRERVRAVHPQHWRRPHSAQQPTRRRTHTVGESALRVQLLRLRLRRERQARHTSVNFAMVTVTAIKWKPADC